MSSRKFKVSPYSRLSLETLETRQMMAGDITASVVNGTLFINEAVGHVGGAQNVAVSQLSGGNIRLTGLTSPVNTSGSLVNGKGMVEFSGVSNVVVNLGAGQDLVQFNSSDPIFRIKDVSVNTTAEGATNDNDIVTLNNFKVLGTVNITTGAGRDVVRMTNSQVAPSPLDTVNKLEINVGVATATGDADKDEVHMDRLTAFADVFVKTGASNDVVTMKNSDVGRNETHLLWFDLGAGDDSLKVGSGPNDVSAVAARSLRVDARDGIDKVDMQDVFVVDGLAVQLGSGDDVLNMVNVQSRSGIALRGESGHDTINLTQVEAFDNFFAYMGEGSDILNITFLKARKAELDGGDGDGYDKLFLQQSPNIPTLIRTGFEEINGQKLIKKGTLATDAVFTRA